MCWASGDQKASHHTLSITPHTGADLDRMREGLEISKVLWLGNFCSFWNSPNTTELLKSVNRWELMEEAWRKEIMPVTHIAAENRRRSCRRVREWVWILKSRMFLTMGQKQSIIRSHAQKQPILLGRRWTLSKSQREYLQALILSEQL